MIPEDAYLANLELASRIDSVPGSIVECGVWRGGMIGGIASLLGNSRTYHLFDSFEGLPYAKEIDGAEAIKWQASKEPENYYDNCAADIQFAERAMGLAKVDSCCFYKGWFSTTLGSFDVTEKIALLRLDGDWYDSTMECLTSLFRQVVPNGLILIDDYYTWDGCSRAVHDFLSETKSTERIASFNGLCYIQKSECNHASTKIIEE